MGDGDLALFTHHLRGRMRAELERKDRAGVGGIPSVWQISAGIGRIRMHA